MKKRMFLFFLCSIIHVFSQEVATLETKKDTIIYSKNIDYIEERKFTEDLKSKYSGKDFTYKEEKKEKIKEIKKDPATSKALTGFFVGFFAFMKFIFPFILGGIVIYIVLKLYLGADTKFWNFKKTTNTVAKKLVYEDEEIDNADIEGLLKRALEAKNTRLAIRYYYLLLLKKLSEKEIITYDKDKTNSDYLFEIADTKKRKQFSYLSYVYTYVWYGEFDLNEQDFTEVQEKYNSFFKTII